MNWKNRLTNYNFWVSIVSAVLLVLQALKIKVDFIYVNEVSTAILGLLVVIGIINDPTKSNKTNAQVIKTEQKQESENDNYPISTQCENGEQTDYENSANQENDEKNLEIDKNEPKNTEIFENLSENLQNAKIFEENSINETLPDSVEKIDCEPEQKQNIPTDDKDEGVDVNIQTDISLDEVNKTETLKIVN